MRCRNTAYALVAQLDRVLDYESRGQGFESLRARHKKSITQSGDALFSFVLMTRIPEKPWAFHRVLPADTMDLVGITRQNRGSESLRARHKKRITQMGDAFSFCALGLESPGAR